jgi:hypothetical protein
MRRFLRPKFLIPAGIIAAVLLGAGLYIFQPWKLFTTTEVYEAVPTSAVDLGLEDSASAAPTATAPSESSEPAAVSPSPEPSQEPAEPVVLAKGSFISHEHSTSGNVKILQLADGTRVLRLEDLQTSDGPQLEVWLSDQPVIDGVAGWGVFDDGAVANLGALKGNVGNQNYKIPADVDLADFSSVSIWCARFSVSFGAAELIPTA